MKSGFSLPSRWVALLVLAPLVQTLIGTAAATPLQEAKTIEVPDRLPAGTAQVVSEGLAIPQAFATWRRAGTDGAARTSDGAGLVKSTDWPAEGRWGLDGFEDGEGFLPHWLPESRLRLGPVLTVCIEAEADLPLPKAEEIQVAVLTRSGALVRPRIESIEDHAADGQWVLRLWERADFVGPDPLAQLALRLPATVDRELRLQVWNLAELRRSIARPWQVVPTGPVELHCAPGEAFGSLLTQQKLQRMFIAST
ncbi:MAG: hypothetical protein R3E96_12870 [Planctomycetota bacterium]